MGREVRRVPANFDWEIGEIWGGFLNPYDNHTTQCYHCDGIGFNEETKEIYDSFYDSCNNGITWKYRFENGRAVEMIGTTRRWCNQLTQDELDALIASGRLQERTHKWVHNEGWVPKLPEECLPPLTAEEFNASNKHPTKCYNFDACDMSLLIRIRAQRLGVYGHCEFCGGTGNLWENKARKALYDAWKPIQPPTGEWWQVWETVSEGSPITPAFETAEQLVDHLVNHGTSWHKDGYTREQAEAFVKTGWVPSAVMLSNGANIKDIEAANLFGG